MGILHRSTRALGRAVFFSAASVGAIALASPALAQSSGSTEQNTNSTATSDSDHAGDIIVTAQFREQRLQDTPIAITAVSGEDIANKGLQSIADIASSAPNVNIQNQQGAYGSPTIYIRGIGQYDSSFAYEQGVGLYIDDVYHGVLLGGLFDLLDLDRVEILRGPQGTLAGKNSIGGAVKLFSQKPQGDGSGYLTATYGSLDRIELRGAYDIGLTEDLALRISGFSKRRDGYVKRLDFNCDRPNEVLPTDTWVTQATEAGKCQLGTLGGIKSFGLRAALRYTPSDTLEVNISGMLTRDDSEPPAVELTKWIDPRFSNPRPYVYYGTYTSDLGWSEQPQNMSNFESITGRIDWNASDTVTLTSITAYENLYQRWVTDEGTPDGRNLVRYYSPYHQFTQEVRLNSDIGDGLINLTVGAFYFDSMGISGARLYDRPILNWINRDPVKTTSKSAFAHAELHPVENLTIIAGARYTKDRKTYTYGRLNSVTGLPLSGADDPLNVGVLNDKSAIYNGHSFDYRLGVDYRFSDHLMAYANFSTGYKGGGANPRPFTPAQAVSFSPERVKAFEVGLKSDFLDNRVRLNVAAFYNKYQDIILIDTNGAPGKPGDPNFFFLSAVPFNAGDADVKGLEFETTIEPTDGLTFKGSLSYLDFEYTKLAADAVSSGVGIDNTTPYTTKWNWSAEVAYEIPLASGASITPRFYADFTGNYYTLPENKPTDFIPSRTMLNANITYTAPSSNWELVVGATNLSDKHYYFTAFDNDTSKVTKGVGRPREFYVSVKRSF